jgi:CDP-4-dehydro-6-deoxyglucose reductase/ferredoxin-NAD(P)+ reductase (naphthalene dioxygenase ferredoxin-specific)
MTVAVTIRQWPKPIAVEIGESLLEAALRHGVPYPHGCRSGNCGACKSRLFEGDVELSPYSEFALSEDEREAGLILACRATVETPAEIGWCEVDDLVVHPRRVLDCRVVDLDDATHDIKRVALAIEGGGPYTFSAGQFASVTFPGQKPRDYSMANRPGGDTVEFHIRTVAGGEASTFVARGLKIGDRVRLEGPLGSSYLRDHHTGPILALAGGSGLAPIKSIVETALSQGKRQPIGLYFGVRDERDLYLQDHFARLADEFRNLRFVPVLSEPSTPTGRRTGFLHEAVASDHVDLDGAKAYVAGPPVMVEAMTPVLIARGLRREDIHADAFYTEAERPRQRVPA